MTFAGLRASVCQDCCDACTLFADEFGSDDFAANYTATIGSWSITGGHLFCLSPLGRVKLNTVDPAEDDGVMLRVLVNFAGHTGDVQLQVDANAASPISLKLNCTGATAATIQFLQGVTAISDTYAVAGFSWTADTTLKICWYYGDVYAQAGSSSSLSTTATGTGSNTVAIRAVINSSAYIDGLQLTRLNSDCPHCVTVDTHCGCPTMSISPPGTVYLTVIGTHSNCGTGAITDLPLPFISSQCNGSGTDGFVYEYDAVGSPEKGGFTQYKLFCAVRADDPTQTIFQPKILLHVSGIFGDVNINGYLQLVSVSPLHISGAVSVSGADQDDICGISGSTATTWYIDVNE